jgi:hypothetical protein
VLSRSTALDVVEREESRRGEEVLFVRRDAAEAESLVARDRGAIVGDDVEPDAIDRVE